MSDQIPYTLGKYRIETEIGRGGFGTVFRAIDVDLDRPVAIKILDPIYLRDTRWVDRFRREARVMAKLDHPHIVTIHEINEEDGRLFLVMKFIDGPDLTELIKNQGALTWDDALQLTGQIASALDFAHEQNVIHRDLKPGNILVSSNGAMLTDFGLAQLIEGNTQSVSMTGGIAGTFNYMAPEVFNDEHITPATDVYGLGCVLYEILTGQMLVAGNSTGAIIGAHLRGIQIDEPMPDGTPPGTRELLLSALAKDPSDRYATAGEMFAEMQRISSDRFAEPYSRLEQALAHQQWQEAIEIAAEIRANEPDYRDVAALEAQAQYGHWTQYWRSEALKAVAANDFDLAHGALSQWRRIDANDPEIVQVQEELTLAEKYIALQNLINDEQWSAAKINAEIIYEQDPSFRDIGALKEAIEANLTAPKPHVEVSEESTTEEPIEPVIQDPALVEGESRLPSESEAATVMVEEVPAEEKTVVDEGLVVQQIEDPQSDQSASPTSTEKIKKKLLSGNVVPILITTLVWAAFALVYLFLDDLYGRPRFGIGWNLSNSLIFGLVVGSGTGLVLKRIERSFNSIYIVYISLGWAFSYFLALTINFNIDLRNYSSVLFYISSKFLIGGILAGLVIASLLESSSLIKTSKQKAVITVGWGFAFAVWGYFSTYGSRNYSEFGLIFSAAVAGAIGSAIMYWQINKKSLAATTAKGQVSGESIPKQQNGHARQSIPVRPSEKIQRPSLVIVIQVLLTTLVWFLSALAFSYNIILRADGDLSLFTWSLFNAIIFGLIAGMGTGLVLKRIEKEFSWTNMIYITAGWTFSFFYVFSLDFQVYVTSEFTLKLYVGLKYTIAGIFIGAIMAYVIMRSELVKTSKQMLIIAAGWTLAITSWGLILINSDYLYTFYYNEISGINTLIFGTTVAGAIGSVIMYWQLYNLSPRTEASKPDN